MSTDNCEGSNFLKRVCAGGAGGAGGSTSPGGSNTQVQYNDAGSFGGSPDFTYDGDKVSIKTLLVTGTGYIEHAQDLYIGDPLITLNSGVTAPNTYDIGFIGDRGATDNIGFIWDESADTFAFIQTTDNGSTIGNVPIDSYKNIKANTGRLGVLGVGTDSPSTTLDVDGAYNSRQMRIGYDGSGNGLYLEGQGNHSHYNWLISQQNFTDESLEFTPSATTGSQTFTTPVFAINREGVNVTGNVKGTGAGDRITLGGTPYLLSGDVVGTSPAGSTNQIQYNDGGSFAASDRFTWNNTELYVSGTLDLKDWRFYNYSDNSLRFNYNNSGDDELTIHENGRVVINCREDLDPAAAMTGQLTIVGAGYTAGIHMNDTATYFGHNSALRRLEFQTDETTRMTIDGAGYVGIGTTGPAEKLDVDGSIKAGYLKIEEGNFGGRIGFNRNPSNGAIYDNSFAAFQINGAEAGADYLDFQAYDSASTFGGSMVLHSGGNVGIGTTNPSTTLDVDGSYANRQMRIGYDGSGNGLYLEGQGNHTHYNWLISQQHFTDESLEFTPSATTGTQTFTTPVFAINREGVNVTGNVKGTGIGNRITLNGLPYLVSGDAAAGGIGYTDLSVTVNSAGTANLAYNNTNGVFTYTPPDLSTYVTSSETGIFVTTSQTGDFVTSSETGIFVTTSQTGDFVTTSQTGDFVTTSQTGDFVAYTDLSVTVNSAGTANLAYNNTNGVFTYTPPDTGSFVTDSETGDFVTTSQTGNFITNTDSDLTGKVLGYDLKAGETFSDGDVIKWESSSNSWLLAADTAGGDASASGNNTNIQYNQGGSFAGSDKFTWNNLANQLFVSGNLELENTIGPFIDFKDTNVDYQVRLGQDFTNSNQLNVSASGGDGDLWVQRRAYLGFADVGTWPASAGYAFFGHGSLNHQVVGNYALLQDAGGETYINAAETKGIHFRTGNYGPGALGDLVNIKGGMGVGMAASGTHGSIVASNDVVAFASSDQRLKDNVTPIANGLDKVLQITGVEFDWNEDAYEHLAGHDVGVIAQNIESVLPEVVATRPDGYKAVRYEKMVPLLIEAIKDQQEQIDQLKEAIQQS